MHFGRTGRTVLVSSHQLAEVASTADRVVIVDGGRHVASGTLDEIVRLGGAAAGREPLGLEDVFLDLTTRKEI